MTLKDTPAAVEQAGTARNRMIYGRHGAAYIAGMCAHRRARAAK